MRVSVQFAVGSALAIGTFIGCAGGESPTPTAARAAVSMSVAEAGAVVARGQSRSTTIAIARPPGAGGVVILSADSVPTGVTVTFLPKRLEAHETSSTATMLVDIAAAPGDIAITFRATDAEQVSATSAFVLSILPPTIALTQDGGAITAVRGGLTVNAFLRLVRYSGANGPVTFRVDSAPPGVVATFAQGTSGVVSIAASASAALGSMSVKVRASMPGVPDVVFTLPFSVISADASGFEVSAPTSTLTVEAGKSATIPVSLQRLGDFQGAVSLVQDSAYGGLRVTETVIASNASTTALRISSALEVLSGEYIVRVRGSASGMPDRAFSVRVIVTPGFSVAVSPYDLPRGGVSSRALTIVRSAGFTGAVTLSVESMPKYLTATFNPNTTTGTIVGMVLEASQTAPAGAVEFDIIASAAGYPDQRTTVRVVIPP
ncbi:MAG: hypothetical protein ABMA00_10175 [Gemmatimonas sp.]